MPPLHDAQGDAIKMDAGAAGHGAAITKLMRAFDSAGVRTSKSQGFQVPPRNIILEVGDQLIGCCKNVGIFLTAKMLVVALPCFVIVAQHTFATNHIRQPVLEAV